MSLRDILNKINPEESEVETPELNDVENNDEHRQNSTTTFRGFFFEIFNEKIYDKLELNSLHKALALIEDSNGVYDENLKET